MQELKAEFKIQPVNLLLIGIMIVLYVAEVIVSRNTTISTQTLYNFGANLAPTVLFNHQWWRLFTAGLLHVSFFHIVFNLIVMYWIGRLLERALGSVRYLILFIFANILGNLFTLALGDLRTISAGASGAIYGMFGSLIVLGILAHWRGFWGEQAKTIGLLVIVSLVGNLFSTGIDLWAHIGGIIAGAALTPLLLKNQALQASNQRPKLLKSGSVILIIGMVGILIMIGVSHGNAYFS